VANWIVIASEVKYRERPAPGFGEPWDQKVSWNSGIFHIAKVTEERALRHQTNTGAYRLFRTRIGLCRSFEKMIETL
jgi:hypothetical protein